MQNSTKQSKAEEETSYSCNKERVMSYTHILVAVAVTPESQQLLAKAVSIARPVNARISLITLASDPEL